LDYVQGPAVDSIIMKLCEMEKSINGSISTIGKAQELNNRKLEIIESKLNELENACCAKKEVNQADDAEDRKRLKERLKEALDLNKNALPNRECLKEDWMEYIFGICHPDGRVGKEGSRQNTQYIIPFSTQRGHL
jgi:hypothetical protein